MQPERNPPPEAGEREQSYLERLRSVVGKLATKMSRELEQGGFGRGELAELRRLDADQGVSSSTLTFWRIVVGELEPHGLIGETARAETLRPWIVILRAMAELAGLHRPGIRLGEALQQAGVSEMRLVRLLRAEGPDLGEQIRPLTHQLRSAGIGVDVRDLAELVLSDATGARGRDTWSETARRRIASAYFRSETSSEPSETND